MAPRRTRVVISVPWDDEVVEHPAQWDYDVLLGLEEDQQGVGVVLIDFAEVEA